MAVLLLWMRNYTLVVPSLRVYVDNTMGEQTGRPTSSEVPRVADPCASLVPRAVFSTARQSQMSNHVPRRRRPGHATPVGQVAEWGRAARLIPGWPRPAASLGGHR